MRNLSQISGRRVFLTKVAAWMGGVLAAPLALLSLLKQRPQGFLPDKKRIPRWHAQCTGFNSDDRLIVRFDIDGSFSREVVLRGLHVRLWCLCGGKLSEAGLVQVLIEQEGLSARNAVRTISTFLRPLYQQGYLVYANADHQVLQVNHEVECLPGTGVLLCRQLTS